MRTSLLLLLLTLAVHSFGQTQYKITYTRASNGSLVENQDPILVFSNEEQSLISSVSIENNKASFPYEQTLINSSNYYQLAHLNATKTITTKDSTTIAKQNFEFLPETRKILGYPCKKPKPSSIPTQLKFGIPTI